METPTATTPPHLRVAVLHNNKENAPASAADYAPHYAPYLTGTPPKDALAELDSPRNVTDYCAALRALGHTVFDFEGNADLPQHLRANEIDLCFNTCEGFRGDSREAQVPALLEMMGIPYSASQVLALAVTLDKAATKRVLHYYGLPTPAFQEFTSTAQAIEAPLLAKLKAGRALFIKPNRGGTGQGIHEDSLVTTEAQLRAKVAEVLAGYQQTALVEEYIEGRDVTCGLVGNLRPDGATDDLHLFPISEVDYSVYAPGTEHFYSYKLKVDLADDYRGLCPAPLPEAIAADVRRLTVETFRACRCLDVARVDFRLDTNNNLQPMILEINALPGMTWNSDLTLCAEAEGWTHAQVLQAIFNAAVDRYGFPRAQRGVPQPNYPAR